MTSSSFIRLTAATTLAAALAACSDTVPVVLGPKAVDPMFTSYVAMGNSITAGYQSGGIVDSTQRESYAFLLAQQMNTRYVYPSLAFPGCAPPVVNFQTQARLGGGTSTTCALRSPSSISAQLNNVAVPGATSFDFTASSTAASNALTTFILGGKTQVERAKDAFPTFISAWIGNNDVLGPAGAGILVPTPGVSAGITDTTVFRQNVETIGTQLKAIPTLKGAVLIGVVQVAQAPLFFPAAALFTPFLGGLDAATGKTIVVHPNCVGSTSLISFAIVAQIASGAHPAVIACSPVAGSAPLGDIFVLDAGEQATLSATVTAYNAAIQAVATANGWAYWDPNPLLAAQKLNGCITTVPDLTSPDHPFGQCFTFDGVHPSAYAHTLIVNGVIGAINTKYGTSIPTLGS